MSHRLRYDRRFSRQLQALPADVRAVAHGRILELADDPRPADGKELVGHPTYFRLWLPRDHRLVWQVDDGEGIIDLLYVGPKLPELYERLGLGRGR